MNKPYIISGNIEAITKDTPYVSTEPNRRARRTRQRPFNNSGRVSVAVTRLGAVNPKTKKPIFFKAVQRLQFLEGKTLVHYKY